MQPDPLFSSQFLEPRPESYGARRRATNFTPGGLYRSPATIVQRLAAGAGPLVALGFALGVAFGPAGVHARNVASPEPQAYMRPDDTGDVTSATSEHEALSGLTAMVSSIREGQPRAASPKLRELAQQALLARAPVERGAVDEWASRLASESCLIDD